jgi:hypothetical protein
MDFLKLSQKPEPRTPRRLPSGSFTMDAAGHVLISTLPQSFPQSQAVDLGRAVLAAFREAREARFSFSELVFHFAALKITAREMRGGAIIFLSATV